jgi:hypothetical protein
MFSAAAGIHKSGNLQHVDRLVVAWLPYRAPPIVECMTKVFHSLFKYFIFCTVCACDRELLCQGRKGLIVKLIDVLKKEPASSPFRYVLIGFCYRRWCRTSGDRDA